MPKKISAESVAKRESEFRKLIDAVPPSPPRQGPGATTQGGRPRKWSKTLPNLKVIVQLPEIGTGPSCAISCPSDGDDDFFSHAAASVTADILSALDLGLWLTPFFTDSSDPDLTDLPVPVIDDTAALRAIPDGVFLLVAGREVSHA